jgi:DNA-binding protein HU-beta
VNKGDLVEAIAEENGVSKGRALSMIDSFVRAVTGALSKDGHVTLSGFGTFSTYRRRARSGHNPRTGEAMKIPSRQTVKFVAGTDLKRAVERNYRKSGCP